MRRVHGIFWLPFARLHGIFLARTAILRNFAAFPVAGLELGIFRVAKSSGEGRHHGALLHRNASCATNTRVEITFQRPFYATYQSAINQAPCKKAKSAVGRFTRPPTNSLLPTLVPSDQSLRSLQPGAYTSAFVSV